jgi:hypothetical protein
MFNKVHNIWLVPVVLLGATSGCAKTGASAGAAPNVATAAQAPAGSACERNLITKADVAGLLSEPIDTVKPLEGDLQSCVFKTAGFSSVTVALRPGLGDMTISAWLSGKMNVAATSVTGVGDRATWTAPLKELNASKNNVLCDIDAIGPESGPATEDKVAVLCNKIFASM